MLEYDKFQKALKHLELQFENLGTLDEHQPILIKEAVAESVIQRFETCYDCMWKVLKRYLTETMGIPEVPNSPKPVFRLAFENNLLSSIEQWLKYADLRVGTSHDYSGEKAKAALATMRSFIDDAIGLYQSMSSETWE
jgi:nucleotidyltransferase substrate binding protein (TIGR01987 family)